jgi:head-tail adaptor
MRIGELRTPIAILRVIHEPDGVGGWIETEKPLATTWAKIDIPKAMLSQVAQQDVELADYEVVIRYVANVQPQAGDVIEVDGERLKILGVKHDTKKRWLIMSCKTEVS